MVTLDLDPDKLEKIDLELVKSIQNDAYNVTLDDINFVVRCWRKWVVDDGPSGYYDGNGEWKTVWRVEFQKEEDKTFFVLKYLKKK